MQQIFLCPTCGAQNYIGQEFCQVCGQRFQYNCPHCGAAVDTTLVNCPGCRESLFWPTPQKVQPFAKQKPVVYQPTAGTGGEVAKPKQKSDPWLMGCLGLVIFLFLVLGAYFLWDTLKPSPTLPDEIGFRQMQFQEVESLQSLNTMVYQVNYIQN